ncbi:MAG: ligase-associated DNA damage response endonuclease PdeM [Cyclobacteriaceae bacterium]|nr:ligase-associated DNA damage response endonuclease PdeM [Cyclobacteriaceae bacterium]MCB0500393.1 ligase-associated DNA damage response endonuclease PdeM [Cyclobacteriaceae bacterium]MCB9238668.1 ligase-associated DNA damage response endonuclease PdeM [Flammeovirgaceae bacterium]MCO5271826.1 ligase-associated DNA damage response endonuclease PdeM [Cyclobacteriaceae bacterium]MCW5901172.1 ligase-associated DNA damage response endonuclease PdeM [Cyclobacteriaceae bacterium]
MVAGEVFKIKEATLRLLPQKAVLVPDDRVLLIADLHLGKANHFRRSGIAVPHAVNDRNMELLVELINTHRPERVVFLGDLFHSAYNEGWEAMGQVARHFSGIQFQLVRGNHDIMSKLQYERCGLQVAEQLKMGPFLLTHEPLEVVPGGYYNLAGHLHPGVRLTSKGKQSITLPCFFFGEDGAVLPAFGAFTGYVRLKVSRRDHVFVIADKQIMKINGG